MENQVDNNFEGQEASSSEQHLYGWGGTLEVPGMTKQIERIV